MLLHQQIRDRYIRLSKNEKVILKRVAFFFYISLCKNLRVCAQKWHEPSNIKGLKTRNLREICVDSTRVLLNLRANSDRAGGKGRNKLPIYKPMTVNSHRFPGLLLEKERLDE